MPKCASVRVIERVRRIDLGRIGIALRPAARWSPREIGTRSAARSNFQPHHGVTRLQAQMRWRSPRSPARADGLAAALRLMARRRRRFRRIACAGRSDSRASVLTKVPLPRSVRTRPRSAECRHGAAHRVTVDAVTRGDFDLRGSRSPFSIACRPAIVCSKSSAMHRHSVTPACRADRFCARNAARRSCEHRRRVIKASCRTRSMSCL